jgi:hypothetical protein
MNYKKIYDSIIFKGKNRASNAGYFESHHIVPKCLGGSNDAENLVNLTPEEHYVCHQLLVKIYPKNRSILYAANMMCAKNSSHKRSNKLYGWLRRQLYQQKLLNCKECGKEFSVKKSRFKREKTKYCSHECHVSNVKNRTNYSTFNCKICDVKFTIPSSHLNEGVTERACSKQCGVKLKQLNARVDLVCLNCNCSFNVIKSKKESKFCSLECCHAYKSKHAWLIFNCSHCNTESKKRKAWSIGDAPKFCSFKCFNDERLKNKIN